MRTTRLKEILLCALRGAALAHFLTAYVDCGSAARQPQGILQTPRDCLLTVEADLQTHLKDPLTTAGFDAGGHAAFPSPSSWYVFLRL